MADGLIAYSGIITKVKAMQSKLLSVRDYEHLIRSEERRVGKEC